MGWGVVRFEIVKKTHVPEFRVGLLKAYLVMLQTKNQTLRQRATLGMAKRPRFSDRRKMRVEKKMRELEMVN